ncbi:MAG: hypothetical protein Q9166_006705 [cf. Caloplaca sp. 2 TL-2023]
MRQALFGSRKGYAFKHTRWSRVNEDEAATLRALVAEVLVLGHPSIKKCRQIITLEGISWDVVDDGASILPVLVFEKAPQGNIAEAVLRMHTNNIIHGDIKPENVLIFNENNENSYGYYAKLSDFGYSTWFARDDELIKMPKSQPWCAPEWHHRGFRVSDAMKMDAYSFGMLSFWLLFRDGVPYQQFHREIGTLTPESRASFVHRIVAERTDIRMKQRTNMWELFDSIRRPSPLIASPLIALWADDIRIADSMAQLYQFDHLRTKLHREKIHHEIGKLRVESDTLRFRTENVYGNQWHEDLAIPFDLVQHHCGHRRLDELEEVYRQEVADLHSVFGDSCRLVQNLKVKLAAILTKQGRWQDAEILQQQVHDSRNKTLGEDHSATLRILDNLASMYQSQNRWKSAQKVGLQVFCTRATLRSVGNLISMYQNEARWKAAGMPKPGIKISKKVLGKMHPDILATTANVTGFGWHLDRWDEARESEVRRLADYRKVLGDNSLVTLMSMDTLAWICLNLFHFETAEKLLTEVIAKRKMAAGYEHPDTMKSISHLSLLYCMRGQWEKAVQLEEEVIKIKAQAWGEEHPSTLTNMANLASIFWTLGQWGKTENLQLQILQKARKALGNEDRVPNTVLYDLLLTYQSQGKWKEWEETSEQVIETKATVSGSDTNPESLMNMINLASAYQIRGRWKAAQKLKADIRNLKEAWLDLYREEDHEDTLIGVNTLVFMYQASGQSQLAEKVDSRLKEMRQKFLGDGNSDTVTRMNELAATFRYHGLWKQAKEVELLIERGVPSSMISDSSIHRDHHGRWTKVEKVESQKVKKNMEKNMKAFGDLNIDTLRSMADLALTQLVLGRFEEAADLQRHIVKRCTRDLNYIHPFKLKSMYDLISTCRHHGSRNKEEIIGRQAEEIEKTREKEFPAALTSAGNLTLTCRNRNRWKGAEMLQTEIIKNNQNYLGMEHQDTLSSIANLASTYASQSRWTEAEEIQIPVMENNKRILGDGHRDTLQSMEDLATTYWNQGRWKQTEDLELQIKKFKEDRLGKDHVDTMESTSNLALTYRNQGRFSEAIELQSQVLITRGKVLGKRHAETLRSMTDLASTYWAQNKLEMVRDLQTQASNIRGTELGDDDPETLESLDVLTMTLLKLGEEEEAEKLAAQILGIKVKRLGNEHPCNVKTLSNLASTYRAQQRWEEAQSINSQILNIQKRVLGEKDPETLTAIRNLAVVYSDQGLWKEAQELQTRGLHIGQRELGEEHPLCMQLTTDLMSTYQGQGCWERLERLTDDFERTTEKLSRAEYPDLLANIAGLALMSWDRGSWDDAVKLSSQVVEIEERTFLEKPSSLTTMARYAIKCWNESRHEEAELVERIVMERNRKTLGSEHPSVLRSLRNLSCIYRSLSRFRDAEEHAVKVTEIGEKLGGKFYPRYVDDLRSLGVVYWIQDRFKEGEKFFQAAAKILEKFGSRMETRLNKHYNERSSMLAATSETEEEWEMRPDNSMANWWVG